MANNGPRKNTVGVAIHQNRPDPHGVRQRSPENSEPYGGPTRDQLEQQALIDQQRAAACKAGKLMVLDLSTRTASPATEYFVHSEGSWIQNRSPKTAEAPQPLIEPAPERRPDRLGGA